MHAGNGDAEFEAHEFRQHFGTLNDWNLAGMRFLHFRIGRTYSRTGDHHRCSGDIRCAVALVNGSTQLRQAISHRTAAQI